MDPFCPSLRRPSDPGRYRIRVRGQVPPALNEIYGSPSVEVRSIGGDPAVTEIIGLFADQTALLSLLDYVDDMGLTLLSINPIRAKSVERPDPHTPTGGN